MFRTSIILDRADWEKLSEVAGDMDMSRSQLLRQFIREAIAKIPHAA